MTVKRIERYYGLAPSGKDQEVTPEELEQQKAAFAAKGGVVQQLPPGASAYNDKVDVLRKGKKK